MKLLNLKFIHTFLSRLSKREKIVFYCTVITVILTIADRLLLSPVFQNLEMLDSQIREKEADIKRMSFILARKDMIVAESAKYVNYLSKAKNVEEEPTVILKEIETIVDNSSMYLIDLKPIGYRDVGQIKKYMVSIACEGQMENVFTFMYNIESSPQLLRIERCEMIPKSKESSIASCNLMISKIIIPENGS